MFVIGCFNSSYDNSQICSCSSDKTVILWDVATGQVARKLRGHAGVSTTNSVWYFLSCSFNFQSLLSFLAVPASFLLFISVSTLLFVLSFNFLYHTQIFCSQKVNCVQFNEEATVILSGESSSCKTPIIHNTLFGIQPQFQESWEKLK